MLLSRRRRRYGSSAFPMPQGSEPKRNVAPLIVIAVFVLLGVWFFLHFFSSSGEVRRVATILATDGRGRVEVMIDGGENAERAETGLKLYSNDRIRTDNASYALLRFFDGTRVIVDQGSTVRLGDVLEGVDDSSIELILESGTLFVESGTGSAVIRSVETGFATHAVPPLTRALIGGDPDTSAERREILGVFTTTGPGVSSAVRVGRSKETVITGEGQELLLTTSLISKLSQDDGDPYSLRDVLSDDRSGTPFVQFALQQREEAPVIGGSASSSSAATTVEGVELMIDEPQDNALLDGEAVIIKGRVGSRVALVRVNGYAADLAEGKYEKEIAIPTEEEFTVEVQAEDKDGLLIETKSIALRHDVAPPDPVVITSPANLTAADMVTPPAPVSMQAEEFEITGTASSEAVGIIVNGYRLQKYVPGKPWAYLINGAMGNISVGENTYEVVAVDRSGNTSEPVRIVILWRAEAPPSEIDGAEPDDRTSLQPGSLRVIAPTTGSPYETSETEVLIEGETHPDTVTMSVNGYRLSLYEAGKVTWNYIAKEEFGNYRTGTNTFTVVARNSEGKILDVLRYVIEKR